MNKLNFNHLEYLMAAVRLKSYAKAARYSFVTPQAIAKSIKCLEKEFGVCLVATNGKNIVPTKEAITLIPYIERVLEAVEQVQDNANLLRSADKNQPIFLIAISANPFQESVISESAISDLISENAIKMQYINRSMSTCLTALRNNVADAAIVLGDYPSESFERVFLSMSRVCLAYRSCERGCEAPLPFSELGRRVLAYPLDMELGLAALRRKAEYEGISLRFEFVDSSRGALEAFFGNGGSMLVPEFSSIAIRFPNIVMRPLLDKAVVEVPVTYLYRKGWRCDDQKTIIGGILKALGKSTEFNFNRAYFNGN